VTQFKFVLKGYDFSLAVAAEKLELRIWVSLYSVRKKSGLRWFFGWRSGLPLR
jgi:hypothetical protein